MLRFILKLLLKSAYPAKMRYKRRPRRETRADEAGRSTTAPQAQPGIQHSAAIPQGKAFDASSAQPVALPKVISGAAYVIDGDTIRIKKTQIRLFGIDAPELNHPHGKAAKWAMVSLCKGQTIKAEIVEEDDHGRTVAKCYLPDGRDLSAELVKQGLAIDWPKFSGGAYGILEIPDARKKMWLADARQKGRMHVWAKFEATRRR